MSRVFSFRFSLCKYTRFFGGKFENFQGLTAPNFKVFCLLKHDERLEMSRVLLGSSGKPSKTYFELAG